MTDWRPGERFEDFADADPDDRSGGKPHIWRTLGYRRTVWEPGHQTIEWEATPEYCFLAQGGGYILHGGMATTVLDSAMGGACWSLLNRDEVFLTGDLRVEFLRAGRPGLLRAEGHVLRRTKRIVFCAADLYDATDRHLASSRCTQVVLPVVDEADKEES